MKEQNVNFKTGFIKKIFVKICRLLGFEIIDQSNFFVPTQEKSLNKNLSIPGKKSINIPLGEVKISRKISALTVIFRACTSINMLTQNKKRLFNQNKSEYTFRTINSLIKSLNHAKIYFPLIEFDFVVIDHDSNEQDLNKIKNQLKKSNFNNKIISLDLGEFLDEIKKTNAKNELVTKNQKSNMSNIYKSLLIAQKQCSDLIYFVEDDYLHEKNAIYEMIATYERFASLTNNELFLCPTDYPYLYTKIDPANIFLGASKHWRSIDETLCTFLTSKKMLQKHWDRLVSMCKFEHYPFEQPLHEIYKSEYCLSPIPSIALHCTNINSVFGLSPNMDWKKVWEENKNY